jgi:hypothetical protein
VETYDGNGVMLRFVIFCNLSLSVRSAAQSENPTTAHKKILETHLKSN